MIDKEEETFWREMERMPDLQKLVARYGRYDLITPEAWEWDRADEVFQARRRVVHG